jgi:hypothetical protein
MTHGVEWQVPDHTIILIDAIKENVGYKGVVKAVAHLMDYTSHHHTGNHARLHRVNTFYNRGSSIGAGIASGTFQDFQA